MGASGPRIRASSCKRARAALTVLYPGRAQEVLAMCEQANELVERTPAHGWVSLEVENAFIASTIDVLGPTAARRTVIEAVTLEAASENSLIGGLYGSTVRLFGLTPNALSKALPPSFRLVYRGVGDLQSRKIGPSSWRFDLTKIPPAMRRLEAYFVAIAGILEALPALCGTTGRAEVLSSTPTEVAWELSWAERDER